MKEIFNQYVNLYDINDPKIKLKMEHSYRVMEKSVWLAKQLQVSEEDLYLAEVIGLLHDFGRFEQIKRYHSFNDAVTVDHGDLGCKILFEEGWIRKFPIDPKYDSIIEKAIRNHNKIAIEDGLTGQELLQAKMIRDADKLDILYNIIHLGQITFEKTEEPISEVVKEHFWNHEPIARSEVKNSNDDVIKVLCFCYDFYYKKSLQYLKEQQYIEALMKRLNHDEMFQPYYQEIQKYIEERIR